MIEGPADDEIVVRLRAAPDPAWDDLWAAADAVAALEDPARWEGGQIVDGVMHVPYPIYDPAVHRLTGALLGVTGGPVVFSWMDWDGLQRYRKAAALADAPVADAARLATAIVRSERFGDGNLEGAVQSGLLAAIVERFRRWRETGT
jgi:hypothetical protein